MDYKRILTLHYTGGMSGREIAEATGVGKTTVNEFLKRFRECEELSYSLSEESRRLLRPTIARLQSRKTVIGSIQH